LQPAVNEEEKGPQKNKEREKGVNPDFKRRRKHQTEEESRTILSDESSKKSEQGVGEKRRLKHHKRRLTWSTNAEGRNENPLRGRKGRGYPVWTMGSGGRGIKGRG